MTGRKKNQIFGKYGIVPHARIVICFAEMVSVLIKWNICMKE